MLKIGVERGFLWAVLREKAAKHKNKKNLKNIQKKCCKTRFPWYNTPIEIKVFSSFSFWFR
jgi:hypothetical protein